MNNIEKEKLGAFISYHSIIRPVALTTHGFWFLSVVFCILFYLPLFLTPAMVGGNKLCGSNRSSHGSSPIDRGNNN